MYEGFMLQTQDLTASFKATSLPYRGSQALIVQIVLLASAVGLPVLAHSIGAPVRLLIPMHWPVILAGMLYGWRAGAITGIFAPLLSYLLSGYPLPNILPSMTAELFVYGFTTGILRQRFNLNAFASIGISILIGRIVFIVFVVITNRASISDIAYFQTALGPGLVAAVLQILSLPFLSQWLVQRYHKSNTHV